MNINIRLTLSARQLAFVKRCHEVSWDINGKNYFGISAATRAEIERGLSNSERDVRSLPDLCKLINSAYSPLTRAWQYFQFDIFLDYAPPSFTTEQVKIAFKRTFKGDRAFTNKRGWDNGYADYINGININSAPMEQEGVISAGSVVEINGPQTVKYGIPCYPIRTLDSTKPPPDDINPRSHPWLFHRAVSSCREGYLGGLKWSNERIEEPFWHLGGNDMWICLLSPGGINHIPASRVILLDSQEIPSPYAR